MKSILEFKKKKDEGSKIKMVTCYDHWSARLIANTDIDCLLVGDSLSMVVHGFESTVHANMIMMELHTAAVARAKSGKFLIADLPFLAHRQGKKTLMKNVDRLMKAGAQAIKIETTPGQEKLIHYLTDSGVPVIGHVGLTPQYIHQLGGYKVQGRSEATSQLIYDHALKLQKAGIHALVLECVPNSLASRLSFDLDIPTIGIGAGLDVDGQVLVLHDLLGFNTNFKPRFVRHFAEGETWLKEAIDKYTSAVDGQSFPRPEESFQ